MNHFKISIGAVFAGAMMSSLTVTAETNRALEAWKAYAAQSGNPNHAKWVEEISSPKLCVWPKSGQS